MPHEPEPLHRALSFAARRCVSSVTEFMAGGSLETVLWDTEPLPWETRLQYAVDIAAGMAYLHKEGVIHRFELPHLAAPPTPSLASRSRSHCTALHVPFLQK